MTDPGFMTLPDLASRQLGGSVVSASDELFASKENLIKPEAPVFAADDFGPKGKIYDGWETRRRRGPEPGHDHAIVRLGAAGIVHGVVVDTAHFRGNYPPEISIEAAGAEGYPSPADLAAMPWETLVGRTAAEGDTANAYAVNDPRRWTHVRLSIYPDGGVARFRVHGQVLPDPRFMTGTIDLVAMENGGQLVGCSNAFFSAPGNLILPGRARATNEGWETVRRRGQGNDYVIFLLGAAGELRQVEIDTSCFVGNAPGWVRLSATGERSGDPADPASWFEVLGQTRVQPDTRHRFLVNSTDSTARTDGTARTASTRAVTQIRLDVIPDGGLARLRAYGEVTGDALRDLRRRWLAALPAAQRGLIGADDP
jgi:allantoicase